VLRPALSDRKGWAIFIGTPKGKNAFWQLWAGDQKGWPGAINLPDWFTLMLKASHTGLIDSAELADARKQMGDDQYAQEYECSFEAAIRGAFYAEEMRIMLAERRLVPIQIDPDIRVHTSWDLGISDSTAIVFWQCVGRERRIVDYYETSGVGLDHYVQVLTEKRLANRWRYGTHFFPHDIAVRELGTGESRKGTLERSGIEVETVPQCSVLDGVNAVRRMLGRTWIDPARCERLIEALRQYRREYDDRLKDWKTNPLHDWTSHGADAVRTFAAGFDDPPATGSSDKRRRDRETEGVSSWAA
jgi:phage terminase large subunit